MDIFLTGENIKKQIISNGKSAKDKVFVSSAFVKSAAFEELCKTLDYAAIVEPILIARWDINDLLSGVSDLEVYELSKKYGWKLYINFDLHAKVYNFDNKYIIGSSNLTQRGLMGNTTVHNIEAAMLVENKDEIDTWFSFLMAKSYLVDDELYEKISKEVSIKNKEKTPNQNTMYSEDFLLSLNAKTKLYTKDLFWSKYPTFDLQDSDSFHDLKLLGLDENNHESLELLKDKFLQTNAWLWLKGNLLEEKYYGELSQLLHNALLDDPAPYRKDVKILLSNLLKWAEIIFPKQILIDRPNHSERIRYLNIKSE